MANIKSQKKRIILNEKGRQRNNHYKSRMKTLIKRAYLALGTRADNAEALVREALKVIDVTAAKGVIHKNNAARQKSKLAKAFHHGVPEIEAPKKKTKKSAAKAEKADAKPTKAKATTTKKKTTKAAPKAEAKAEEATPAPAEDAPAEETKAEEAPAEEAKTEEASEPANA